MQPGDVIRGKDAAGDSALHRQYLEPHGPTQGSSIVVSGGADHHRTPNESAWSGDGILKTVKMERVESTGHMNLLSRPQKAMLSPGDSGET